MARVTMNRRRFLTLAGLGAAASAVPIGVGVKKLVFDRHGMDVGVLAAPAGGHPDVGRRLLHGLRLGFADAPGDTTPIVPRLITRPVVKGYGGAWTSAQALLEEERVDLVVARVTAPTARHLAPLFEDRQVPLVVANMGAHVVRPRERHGQVLHSSLGYWQASFAFGRWAARNLGPRGYVAASIVDAGYDTLYAFRRGLESAGGTVVRTKVTGVRPSRGELTSMFRSIGRSRPDFVYAMYSGDAAADFVSAYRRSSVNRLPLAGTAFLVDDGVVRKVGSAARGVLTASSWSPADRTGSARGRAGATDPSSVLGYEAARLIAVGARRANELGTGTSGIVPALSGRAVDGLRGRLLVDAASNVVLPPLSIREVGSFRGGFAALPIEPAGDVPAFPAELSAMDGGLFSGWVNEYLSP
jgi:ABC-type branched-subunit amino acid transport system substrate-binding protein